MASEEETCSVSIEDLLNTWDLSAYVGNFVLNEFGAGDIFNLCDDLNANALKELIPIGSHRLRFKTNVRALLAAQLDVSESFEGVQSETESSKSFSATVPASSKPLTAIVPSRESMEESSTPNPTVLRDLNSNHLSSTGSELSNKRKSSEPLEKTTGIPPPKRRSNSENSSSNNIPDQELVELLKKTGSGRVLLALSKKCQSLEHDKDVHKLCEIVIDNKIIAYPNYKISSSQFPEIVKSIISLFPKENESIYYIPYRKDGDVKCLSKGKLVSKYYHLRKELKAGGLLQAGNGGDNDSDDDDYNNDDDDDGSGPIDAVQEKINFLQENTTPWDNVVAYWKDTARLRLSSIQKLVKAKSKKTKGSKKAKEGTDSNDTDSTVISYIASYPPLRTKEGFTLFEADFAKLYPDASLKIYSDFDDFIKQAIKALEKLDTKKFPTLANNLEILEDGNLTKEAKELLVLLSLCYLDSVVTVSRAKRDGKIVSWRPPHAEIQEGFVSHCETPGRVDSFISKRFLKFESWGLPVQPFVVACGPTIDDIGDCYVVISKDVKFNGFTSVKRALDVCFKIIHAVNAEYSCESYRLWMLVQKRLYGLDTKADQAKNDAQLPAVLKRFDC